MVIHFINRELDWVAKHSSWKILLSSIFFSFFLSQKSDSHAVSDLSLASLNIYQASKVGNRKERNASLSA